MNNILLIEAKEKFENILEQIVEERDINKREVLAKTAIKFALSNSTCYYSSPIIEKVFIDIANTMQLDQKVDYKPNSFLHVMTACWYTGGHTRVVERWVELSDDSQKHSLIFTELENQPVPDRLVKAIGDKCGDIIFLEDKLSDREKGIKLREIASEYEAVILHVHMHDIVPIIAFGTESFKRPIIFFNHADHLFWVGVSIADIVADLREFGQDISISLRGVNRTEILSVPMEIKWPVIISKSEARSKLGVSEDSRIILTVGSAHKYVPIMDCDFLDTIKEILIKDERANIIAIGPDFQTFPEWKTVSDQFGGRLYAIGQIPHDKLYDYIFASDVMLDSRPMSGGVALTDGVACGRPVLSVDNPVGQFDWVKNSMAFCSDIYDMTDKAIKILQSEELQKIYADNESDVLKKINSADAWVGKLKKILYDLPKAHYVYQF